MTVTWTCGDSQHWNIDMLHYPLQSYRVRPVFLYFWNFWLSAGRIETHHLQESANGQISKSLNRRNQDICKRKGTRSQQTDGWTDFFRMTCWKRIPPTLMAEEGTGFPGKVEVVLSSYTSWEGTERPYTWGAHVSAIWFTLVFFLNLSSWKPNKNGYRTNAASLDLVEVGLLTQFLCCPAVLQARVHLAAAQYHNSLANGKCRCQDQLWKGWR